MARLLRSLAGVAIYLASRAGAYLTGTVIPVDVGITIKAQGWTAR